MEGSTQAAEILPALKIRASGAQAGFYLHSLHIPEALPTAAPGRPSQQGSQELTCPLGACQNPCPRGTGTGGQGKVGQRLLAHPLFMQIRKPKAHDLTQGLGSRTKIWAGASPNAVSDPIRG